MSKTNNNYIYERYRFMTVDDLIIARQDRRRKRMNAMTLAERNRIQVEIDILTLIINFRTKYVHKSKIQKRD
jgi:hypothetical protein